MKSMITKRIEKLLHDQKARKRYLAVFSCLAAVVVLGTVMMLRYSGIAMTHKEKVLTCSCKVHEHKKSCYTKKDGKKVLDCGYADYVVHVHNDDCYDAEGKQVCTLPEIEEHKHDASCYKEERVLMCDKKETEGHQHTDSCYKEEKGELACRLEEHEHTDECYGEDGSLICEKEEHKHSDKCYEYKKVLDCGMKENEGGHKHDDSCYEKQKVLTCKKLELHTHDKHCYDKKGNLTCGLLQLESHVHSGDCFEVVEVTENSQEEDKEAEETPADKDAGDTENTAEPEETEDAGNAAEPEETEDAGNAAKPEEAEKSENTDKEAEIYTLHEEDKETADADQTEKPSEPAKMSKRATAKVVSDTSEGTLNVTLLYGDQAEHPDGASYYTHATMSGFIKLEPKDLTKDLQDVTVMLKIPKAYVEKGTVKIPEFTTDSKITKYTIPAVTEDDDNYYASINFEVYDKTQTLQLPFALSFKDDIVPDNYELPVTATVTQDSSIILSASEEIIYKPLYKEWGIAKFVNSNRLDAFSEDGAEVVVTSKDPDGNPYLSGTEYVEFYFRVNRVINSGSNLDDYRDVTSVTLTDTLPSYVKKDGSTAIAVFDPAVNQGWTLGEDEKTVSKTYTGKDSHEVLLAIYEDGPLKLQFPELKFEQDPKDEKNLIAAMDNKVDLLAIPSGEAEGETRPTATDPLHFVITTDPGTDGRFSKQAMKGNIYDTDSYKTNPYPWGICVSNDGMQPLEHIRIQDRKIPKSEGENGLGGLDERLKFVKLESNWRDSIPAESQTITNAVEEVVAYYTDGTTDKFPITCDQTSGDFTVEFDSRKVCNGYEIIFKDDFKLQFKETVSFKAYTVYRDPENTVVPDGTEKVRFENSARSVNSYQDGNEWVFDYLTVTHGYDMLPVTEKLQIKKATYLNSSTENNKIGDVYRYWISLWGYLSEEKEYGKIYLVDLLPNEVDFEKVTNGSELFTGGGYDSLYQGVSTGVSATPKIVGNYHNSGRTALIWELPLETLKIHLNEPGRNNDYFVAFQIQVKIRKDARPGTVRNNIYVVGENLDEYSGETGGTEDIYDLNNNGRTNDMIAYDHSDAVIVAAESVYAEKFIAPADTPMGSGSWSKQGLSLKAGMDFDYLLKVTNETSTPQTNLVICDTLPTIGDKGVLIGSESRNSEFPVQLREAVDPPDGYEVLYTTQDVSGRTMTEIVSEDIWVNSGQISDWSAVTAFKLEAQDGVELRKDGPFQVQIPAHVPEQIPVDSQELLKKKEYTDQTSGTMAYLEATNNFGFTTAQAANPKESNSVWVRMPFAGFTIKKVDQEQKEKVLPEAEFELTKSGDETFKMTGISDERGSLGFRDLTEGTYTLTETKAPAGYEDGKLSLTVTITQDPVTMGYNVEFKDSDENSKKEFDGAGTKKTPLIIENIPGYVLPKTGGVGAALYTVGGILLAVVASLLMFIRRKRERA